MLKPSHTSEVRKEETKEVEAISVAISSTLSAFPLAQVAASTVAGRWHHSPYGVSQAGRACPPRKGCDTSRQLIGRDRGEKEEHQSSAGTDAPLLSVNAGEGCSHCQRCVSARSKHLQRPQCQQGWGKQQRDGHRATSCLSVLTHQIPTFFTQQPPRP